MTNYSSDPDYENDLFEEGLVAMGYEYNEDTDDWEPTTADVYWESDPGKCGYCGSTDSSHTERTDGFFCACNECSNTWFVNNE